MSGENANSSDGNGNPPEPAINPQKLEKMLKNLEKKLKDSENQRERLEQRYDHQSKLFDKTVEELDASKALIGEQFRKIESILRNINQGIVVVDGQLNLDDQRSRAVDDILGGPLPPNANLMKDILDQTDLSPDSKSKINTAIVVSVGENEFNYELNKDNFPREMRTLAGERILEIDWNPTLKDDLIENFIISIRDVTQVRSLQKKAEHINLLVEIVENDPKEIYGFLKRSRSIMQENLQIMQQTDKSETERIETMFRNAHTAKGSARIYNLSKIVNSVHELESLYQDIRNSKATYDNESMTQRLQECLQAIDLYEEILVQKFHLEENGAGNEEDRILTILAKMKNASESERGSFIADLLKEYSLKAYHPLNRILQPIIRSIADIAMELNKPCPTVDLKNGNLLIHGDVNNLVVDAFSHLLRNSLDHGMESAADREAAGKNRTGLIKIWGQFDAGAKFGHVFLEDDGRGLNLGRLRSMAPADHANNPELLAEMIFKSGVSTATEVTQISGRGIGMDAVRQTLRSIGGEVAIEFTAPEKETGFRNFRFKLTMPASSLVHSGGSSDS